MINSGKKVFAVTGSLLMLLLIVLSAGCVTDMTVKFYVDDRVYYQTSVDGTNPINLPPNPTKDGYYFAGWYFDKGVWEKPLTVTSLLEMPIAGEIAVYAYFTGEGAVSYKVTLDSNGGSFVEPVSVLKNGKIPVQLTLEGEQENLNRVIDRFNELGVDIIEKDGVINKEFISTILIGHIVDKDVRDTTDKINALDGIYVVGFDIKLDGEDKSTALINLEVAYGKKQFAFDEVKKIADEKDLLMINEV